MKSKKYFFFGVAGNQPATLQWQSYLCILGGPPTGGPDPSCNIENDLKVVGLEPAYIVWSAHLLGIPITVGLTPYRKYLHTNSKTQKINNARS